MHPTCAEATPRHHSFQDEVAPEQHHLAYISCDQGCCVLRPSCPFHLSKRPRLRNDRKLHVCVSEDSF